MTGPSRYRSSFYLLEGMSAILLLGSLLSTVDPQAAAGLGFLLGGLFWHRVRQASWFTLILIALVGLVAAPSTMDAYVVGLAGVYLVFNSGLWGDKPVVPGVLVLVLAFGCQIAGMALHPDHWRPTSCTESPPTSSL